MGTDYKLADISNIKLHLVLVDVIPSKEPKRKMMYTLTSKEQN